MTFKNQKNNGFTLLEILISLSILVLITTLILVSFNALNNKQTLDKQMDFIESAVSRTRTNAINSLNSVNQTFTFASTSVTYDGKTINLDSNVSLLSHTTGTTSITFSRLTGYPNATGTLVYKLQKGNTVIATSSILINNLGIIE